MIQAHRQRTLIPLSLPHLTTVLGSSLLPLSILAAPLVDDRHITVQSNREVMEKRQALIQYLWGEQGFPAERQPAVVLTNVTCPVKQLTNLDRVDELRIALAPDTEGLAYHFIAQRSNGELVVVHQGHACTMDDNPAPVDIGNGLQRTIKALLREGYGVLGVFMPHMRPGDCTGGHNDMFQTNTLPGSPIRLFLESTAIGLNHVKNAGGMGPSQKYRAFHMIGLSGGGWTTTVYAALDPTIRCSIPVAGTIPLYLRSGGSIGDREQFEASFYRLAGYPDLYILGAHGDGRKQVQILLRRDDCCFGEAQHDEKATGLPYAKAMREYESRVRNTLRQIGSGSFRLEIDETAPSHMISHYAIEEVILPELRRVRTAEYSPRNLQEVFAPVVVGSPPVNAFNGLFRCPDGEIRHYGDDGTNWTGFRELRLNPFRNEGDFGARAEYDFSVHQPQALELPGGNVLVAHGQDAEVRALVLFDPQWLYEARRRCAFENGLEDWSTHQYLKGIVDHWFNPTDPVVQNHAMYVLPIPGDGRLGEGMLLTAGRWHELRFDWADSQASTCRLSVDGTATPLQLPLVRPSVNGISYVHFQALSEQEDPKGFLI